MLLHIFKMGVRWYFRFVVKTTDNRDKLEKAKTSGPDGELIKL